MAVGQHGIHGALRHPAPAVEVAGRGSTGATVIARKASLLWGPVGAACPACLPACLPARFSIQMRCYARTSPSHVYPPTTPVQHISVDLERQPCDADVAHQSLLLQPLQRRQRLVNNLRGTADGQAVEGGQASMHAAAASGAAAQAAEAARAAGGRQWSHPQTDTKGTLPALWACAAAPPHLVQLGKLDVVALDEVHVGKLQAGQRLAHAGGHTLGAAGWAVEGGRCQEDGVDVRIVCIPCCRSLGGHIKQTQRHVGSHLKSKPEPYLPTLVATTIWSRGSSASPRPSTYRHASGRQQAWQLVRRPLLWH